MPASQRHSAIAIVNHWVTAILVAAMLVLGWVGAAAPTDDMEHFVLGVHIALGFFVFLFVVWRIAVRLHQEFPPEFEHAPWQRRSAHVMHRLLLAVLLMQVLTGPLYLFTEGEGMDVFGWFTVAIPLQSLAPVHELMEWLHVVTGVYLLPALLALHLLGALRYYWQDHPKVTGGM